MTNNFPAFAKIVHKTTQTILANRPFVVGYEPDALYDRYLKAFPESTDPIFKKRSEHDCSCCKQFIRHVGNVIAVSPGGALCSIWDDAANTAPFPYNVVAKELRHAVVNADIVDMYRANPKDGAFGAEDTHSQDANGDALTWYHFFTGPIPNGLRSGTADADKGNFRTTVQVFARGLRELTPEAVDTVMSLIDANALYRGEEHRAAVSEFQAAQRKLRGMSDRARDVFAWVNAAGPAARFRNTVIGTLVQDLSSGVDVERAVASFETKVAPQNYKRTSAVITPGMVAKAMETVQELGLEPALERRFARIEDISVRDVLWTNNGTRSLMKGGLHDALLKHAESQVGIVTGDEKRAEPIGLDAFIKDVAPSATGMDLLFRGSQIGNLVTLTAPVHPEPRQLFRWPNDFAWSYCGNVTDSIKERVKKAGGNVSNAELRVSLSWFNHDDLDLHVIEPGGGHIAFHHKRGAHGELDVDMNVSPTTREAVENVSFVRAVDGDYLVGVNNYTKRESIDVGFTIEVENAGRISHYTYKPAVRNREDIHVVALKVRNGVIVNAVIGNSAIVSAESSREKWGLKTETYVRVNAITLSPNHWGDSAVGNKHVFFIVDGAKCDEPTRGIYNEFLHQRLEPHRKVFEVIGEKTKCQPTDGQLSGLGFSSTKRESVVIRVAGRGGKVRLYSVQIGERPSDQDDKQMTA